MRYYKFTGNVEARKTHVCCYCGAAYSYLTTRKVFGFGLSEEGAAKRGNKNAERVWLDAADIKPCPNCGRCQSEMFADFPRARFCRIMGDGAGCLLGSWIITLAIFASPFFALEECDEFPLLILAPYALWLAFVLAMAPTLRNFNRNPQRNLKKMEKSEKLRSEALGFRPECARKQRVKLGWFRASAFWLAAFSFCYCAPLLEFWTEQDWGGWPALGAAITAFAFVWSIVKVPESFRVQGEAPITTNASPEALEALRQAFGGNGDASVDAGSASVNGENGDDNNNVGDN